MDKIIEAIINNINPGNIYFFLLICAICFITYSLAPAVKNKETPPPAKEEKMEEVNKQDLIHDHTKCPNYATCQQLKEDLKEKAEKKEVDDLQKEFKAVSNSIAVLTYATTQSGETIKAVNSKIDDLINKLIERKL